MSNKLFLGKERITESRKVLQLEAILGLQSDQVYNNGPVSFLIGRLATVPAPSFPTAAVDWTFVAQQDARLFETHELANKNQIISKIMGSSQRI